MKKMSWLLLCTLIYTSVLAKEDPKYPVSAIPEDMKTGMYAVIRESELKFEINSVSNTNMYYHIVITILNSNAKHYAKKVIGYDKFNVIKSFKGTAYDASGNVIKKLKQNEIYDQSAFDGFSLYSDNRVKRADLSQGTYPYTVEFEYELEAKYLYNIPDFYLYSDDEISIQKNKYAIVYAAGLKPRYKLFKISEPKINSVSGRESLEWSFENIRPDKFEKLSPDIHKVIPNVNAAPVAFEFDGYAGRMDSWRDFGKWQTLLNEGREALPETTKQRVRELTKNAKTNEEKIRILYEFMQNKTRYVSIQLGIGGLQPFEAKVVDQTGYGDCKALSNYMVSLLKEVGITGYYTTVMAGDDALEVDPTFPMDQSNHVIVAVPNLKDTIWLECTSQTAPLGYMGNFTGDRYALMVTEGGGKLVKTPTYTADQNVQSRSADVFVESTGDAKAKIKTTYSGLQYENGDLMFILNKQHDDQKEWVQDNTDIPAFDIVNFSMTNKKDKVPSAIVNINLVLKRFATVSGKRIFLTPNLMNRSTYIPEKLESRKTNIVLRTPYTDFDTICYHLPEGIYPEFLPEPANIKSRFGEYETTFTVNAGSLLYIRKIRMNKGEYPAESYKELTDFYKNINKADNMKMVFMSKT
jgi:transglutaminase-like putative cysteine protease